ncbi:MAG TPA: hypothetical protein VJO33_01125 [Gemmatimonadaceae bacterium]|nr:hypothetical protein [Gemmatimonadaceae bacterium]
MGQATRAPRLFATAGLCCLTAFADGCFLRKYVYRPTLVANAIGDSTTTLSGTRVHVYKSDEYEIYGPTASSVSFSEQQTNRAYREFAKHFGVQGPPMIIVIADSTFVISPADAALFTKRRTHTFVYVRPHNLRDVEGVTPDTPEDEIWPVSSRVARELVTAYVASRRHVAPEVETTAHPSDYHTDPLPIWFVDGVVTLLSDPGAPDRVMEYLKSHLNDAPPVATLLDMHAPNAGVVDTMGTSKERRSIVGAEGVGLTLFLVEREGPRVVGRLADALLSGGTARDVINDARHVPQNEREFERVFRTWVREEYGR